VHAKFRLWRERENQQLAARLESAQRQGVARYSFRWALVVGAFAVAAFLIDTVLDDRYGCTFAETAQQAIEVGVMFAIFGFVVTYALTWLQIWLSRRREP
jgi:uncharacterized membrane protein